MNQKIIIFLILVFLITSCLNDETTKYDNSIKFDSLIKNLNFYKNDNDTFKFPTIYKKQGIHIEISNNPIPFFLSEVILKNPFPGKSRISYSVILENKLISLFDNGKLICYIIPSMKRDYVFEQKINTKFFQYHWVLDNKLIVKSDGVSYFLNQQNQWECYLGKIPFNNQPILFEDNKYIISSSCFGEWGGLIYFYNKLDQKIHCASSDCPRVVYKNNYKYMILSSICETSELLEIEDVEKLPIIDSFAINQILLGSKTDYHDFVLKYKIYNYEENNMQHFNYIFNGKRISAISNFKYNKRNLILMDLHNCTFISEFIDGTFYIVNPLFNKNLIMFNPITTYYQDGIIVNYEHHSDKMIDDLESPVKVENRFLLIYKNQITNYSWNDNN